MEPISKIQRHYDLPYKLELWEEVRPDLIAMAQSKFTVKQLCRKLQYFHSLSTFRSSPPDLDSLFSLAAPTLIRLYSQMAEFILRFQSCPPSIPLLRQNEPSTHTFPKQTIVLLLSLMACFLTPSQQLQSYQMKQNFSREWNFSYIFSYDSEKMQPIVSYLSSQLSKPKIEGNLVIVRRCEKVLHLEEVRKSEREMCRVEVKGEKTDIEEFTDGVVRMDFANKFIGGGALDYGNAQEEIMFLCHPEMFVSMLLCEKVKDNEVIGFQGFQKYFRMSGYRDDLKYEAEETSIKYEQDENGIIKDYIVAIDALKKPDPQYSPPILMRQLNKAYIGFTTFPPNIIATGNWGCGVFGGDPQLKFIIQWLSCSLAKKDLIYCSYGNRALQDVDELIDKVRHLKVGELMKVLLDFEGQMKDGRRSVFDFMLKVL